MLLDLLLLSVIALTGYLGTIVLWRLGPGQRVYGTMLLADLVVAGFALIARKSDDAHGVAGIAAAVAIGGAVGLLVVPPILRKLSRRAVMADRLGLAAWLVDLRELLQPGMGGQHERELIDAIRAVRAGDVDAAVAMLRERRAKLGSVEGRRQIDERVIMTYLYARRWDDAIAYFEGNLPGRIGASPQLVVEMVRAYGETGNLSAAADLITRLESSPMAEEPLVYSLVWRARLMFLAFVGRTGAVEAMCAQAGSPGTLPVSSRYFWSGVARLNAGDRNGARLSFSEARRLSGRDVRARELAEAMLESLEDGARPAAPRVVPADVAAFADRLTAQTTEPRQVAAQKRPPELGGVAWRKIPVTAALIAVNLAVALTMWLTFGTLTDMGALAKAGANLKPAVLAGEWWRLLSSMFLHVGAVHLALNMYGLWILGKLCEQLFGSVRLFGLYMVAGLAGSLASVLVGGPQMSAGASGAIFGLLGAATVELALRKSAFPRGWRRALLGNLLFLTAANVGIGFAYPAIDQAAHIGGLVMGALLALVLSPRAAFAQRLAARVFAAILVGVSAIAVAYAGHGVATTRYADTLAQYEVVTRTVGGLEVEVPSLWQPVAPSALQGKSSLVSLYLERVANDLPLEDAIAVRLGDWQQTGAARLGAGEVKAVPHTALALPKPWQSRELVVQVPAMSGSAQFRIAVFGRRAGDELWLGSAVFPAALADDISPAISRMLTSAKPVN